MGPDDLEIGKTYRFDFVASTGVKVCVRGVYRGNSIVEDTLWFDFQEDDDERIIVYEYAALNNLREVEP